MIKTCDKCKEVIKPDEARWKGIVNNREIYKHAHCPESSDSQMRSNASLGQGSERASAPTDPEGEQSKSESAISALGRAPKDCLLKDISKLIVEYRRIARKLAHQGNMDGFLIADEAADRLHNVLSKYGKGSERP